MSNPGFFFRKDSPWTETLGVDMCRNNVPYNNHFTLSRYSQHPVQDNQRLETTGHRFWAIASPISKASIYTSHSTSFTHTHYVPLRSSCEYPYLAVREITKSSSTFSATNISSNMIGLLQLHDALQMKSYFGTRFSSIYLAKGEKRLVNLQRAKHGTHMFDAKYRYVLVV